VPILTHRNETVSPRHRRIFHKLVSAAAALVALAIGTLATPAWANPTWISCTPIGTATFQNRVHVRCAASVGGISYFATSTSDSGCAARILSLGASAQVAGRRWTSSMIRTTAAARPSAVRPMIVV
jgi:hypothetical protein